MMDDRLMRCLWSVLLVVMLGGCGHPDADRLRVLFIGNSYTRVNDLPQVFADLSRAGHRPVQVEAVANDGWTLSQHVAAPETVQKIASQPWDYVILQEQSVVPAVPSARTRTMYPAVRQLVRIIRARGAKPVLYLTWGRRHGLKDFGFVSCAAMQAELNQGTMTIARELGTTVAPVGPAWLSGSTRDPSLALWQGDDSHPTLAGTYLAGCVFYATLYRQSPEGLSAPSGIPDDLARRLQAIARETVQTNPDPGG